MKISALRLLFGTLALSSARADGPPENKGCPDFPPVGIVAGANIYKSGTNSVHDAQGASQNHELLAPVLDFMAYAAKSLNERDDAGMSCAFRTLQGWSKANALLKAPETPGRVSRVWITVGFGFLLQRFKAHGRLPDSAMKGWFTRLAGAVRLDYEKPFAKKGNYANIFSNVYPWTAASSALSALLSGDPEAARFENLAWSTEIAQIQPDGSLPGEMGRGGMARNYHLKYAEGVLVHRAVRLALGRGMDSPREKTLRKLLDFIGAGICRPEIFAKRAGAAQDPLWAKGYGELLAAGGSLLSEDFRKCAPRGGDNYNDPEYFGGDSRDALESLKVR